MNALKTEKNTKEDIVLFLRKKIENLLEKREFIRFFANTDILIKDDFAIDFIFRTELVAKAAFINLFKQINLMISNLWPQIDISLCFVYRSANGDLISINTITENEGQNSNQVETIGQNLYKFEDFVEDETNKSASMAVKSIACFIPEELISVGGTCFINGGEGVGKTHLLKSAENYYNSCGGSACYIRGSDFLRNYIKSVQSNDINGFFNKMNSYDIFVLDNVEYFIGKTGTINALTKILNDYSDQHKYVIISSRLSILEIINKEPKLKDILGMAIGIEIKSPSTSLKKSILNKEITTKNLQVPMQITDLIVNHSVGGIKGLKFNLNKISLYHKIHGVEINEFLASDFISIKEKENIKFSDEEIIELVSSYHKTDKESILSKIKTSSICEARHEAMYFLHKMNNLSYTQIAKIFSKNHSTIISGIEKVENKIKTNSKYPGHISEVKNYMSEKKIKNT